jgi:hypothetical protein
MQQKSNQRSIVNLAKDIPNGCKLYTPKFRKWWRVHKLVYQVKTLGLGHHINLDAKDLIGHLQMLLLLGLIPRGEYLIGFDWFVNDKSLHDMVRHIILYGAGHLIKTYSNYNVQMHWSYNRFKRFIEHGDAFIQRLFFLFEYINHYHDMDQWVSVLVNSIHNGHQIIEKLSDIDIMEMIWSLHKNHRSYRINVNAINLYEHLTELIRYYD